MSDIPKIGKATPVQQEPQGLVVIKLNHENTLEFSFSGNIFQALGLVEAARTEMKRRVEIMFSSHSTPPQP